MPLRTTVTLCESDTRRLISAISDAANEVQKMAQEVAPGIPAFGVDDDPAEASVKSPVEAGALMFTLTNLRQLHRDISTSGDGDHLDGTVAFSVESVGFSGHRIDLHLSGDPVGVDTLLVQTVYASAYSQYRLALDENGRKPARATMKMLGRLL